MSNIRPFKHKLIKRTEPLSEKERHDLFVYFVEDAKVKSAAAKRWENVDENKLQEPIIYAPPRTIYLLDNNIK